MDVDPAAGELAAAVSRPDGQIDLTRAALIIAKSEYPTLDVPAYLDRLAQGIASRARHRRHDSSLLARKPIEQARFADVRAPGEHHANSGGKKAALPAPAEQIEQIRAHGSKPARRVGSM